MSLLSRGRIVVSWSCGENIVCGARFHSVECIAAARLENTSSSTDGFQRHPQTIFSPPPQRKIFTGTKDSSQAWWPVRRCLARYLTSLALLRTPKSANGPRSNSFRPDSPSTTTYPRGRKTQTNSPATPDMVHSGRVLRASVKSQLIHIP